MRKFKAAFFDLDWTLYDHKNHGWDRESVEAIRQLKQRGTKVFICTARSYHSFLHLGAMNLGIAWDGYIASAGGYCFADGKYLYTTRMKRDDVIRFLALAKERGKTLELIELKERKLMFPLNEAAKEYYRSFCEVVPEAQPYEGEDVEGINFFSFPEDDEFFQKAFPHLLYYRYCDMAVDITPVVHEKGKCVKKILSYYGISKEESLGFGDDLQDLSLAKEVGYFICMGNGKEEVKQVADYVTETVWNGGVCKALKHLLEN